jgi:RNA polymerase sigma-70 factor (ECF subfamily)
LGLETAGRDGGRSLISFAVGAGRITRIDVVRNPDKLQRIPSLP